MSIGLNGTVSDIIAIQASVASAIDYWASGLNTNGAANTPGMLASGQLASTSVTSIVSPASGQQDTVTDMAFYNVSGSTVTLKVYRGGTSASNQTDEFSLAPGYKVQYGGGQWYLYTSAGLQISTIGGAAGGDLSGAYPNPTVAAINGSPLGTTTGAATSAVLGWSGSAWIPQTVLIPANNLSELSDAGTSRFNLQVGVLSAVAAVAVANVTLSAPGATIDGYSFQTNDEVLLTAQSTTSQNGPWIWNGASSALTRPHEYPSAGVIKRGRAIQVANGTVYAGSIWGLAAPASGLTIDTTAQVWTQINVGTLNAIATAHPTTANWDNGGFKITGGATPTSASDFAIKSYVDAVSLGLSVKTSAQWATVGTETFTITSGAVTQISGTTIDGNSPAINDRILIKNAPVSTGAGSAPNTTEPANGLYLVTGNTTNLSVSRTTDMTTGAQVPGAFVFVEGGTTNTGAGFIVASEGPYTIGTTAILFTQFSGAGEITNGAGLSKSGNTLSITNSISASSAGSATQVPAITWNAQGELTAITATNISLSATGDATGTLPGALTLATVNVSAGVPGTFGSATQVGQVTINAKGLVTAVSNVAITGLLPSGTSTQILVYNSGWTAVTMAGDTTIGATGTTTNVALQGHPVVAVNPAVGQQLSFRSAGWSPSTEFYNIQDFGADPTNTADSTLAIYNATVMCAVFSNQIGYTTTLTTAASTGFTLAMVTSGTTASTLPTSSTGNVVIQTTLGTIVAACTFSSGSITVASGGVTLGVTGGSILAGSIVGVQDTYTQGGVVYSPQGLYKISSQVNCGINGVCFMGPAGMTNNNASGTAFYLGGGAMWVWAGSLGNSFMLSGIPIFSSSHNTSALTGFQVVGMNFDCAGASGTGACNGIQLISCQGYNVENTFVYDPIQVAYDYNVLAASLLGEAQDCTRGTNINLRFRCLEQPSAVPALLTNAAATVNINTWTGAGTLSLPSNTNWPTSGTNYALLQALDTTTGTAQEYLISFTGTSSTSMTGITTLGIYANAPNAGAGPGYLPSATLFAGSTIRFACGGNATGIRLHGSTTANSCCSTYTQVTGVYYNGPGINFANSDSNTFVGLMINQGGSGGAGFGCDFQGATAAGGLAGTSRNNQLYGGSPGVGGCVLRGIGSFTYTNAPLNNYWHNQQIANGEPAVLIGGTGVEKSTWSYNGEPVVPMPIQASLASFSTTQTVVCTLMCNANSLHIGSTYRLTAIGTYTATAGTTANSWGVFGGTSGTSTDTTLSGTGSSTPTAVSSVIELEGYVTFQTVVAGGSATSVVRGTARMTNSLAATGFSTIPVQIVTSSQTNANLTTATYFVTLQIKTGSTSQAIVITQAFVERIG